MPTHESSGRGCVTVKWLKRAMAACEQASILQVLQLKWVPLLLFCVDWDILTAMLGLLAVTWVKIVAINRNTKIITTNGKDNVCVWELQRKGGGRTWIEQINCRHETGKWGSHYSVKLVKKKWQHVCHYNLHSFVLYCFISDRILPVSQCF